MAVALMPVGNDAPFVDANGDPLNAGTISFYTAGSTTPQPTYTTSLGNVQNANPVVLNSNGYPSNGSSVVQIWGTVGVSYKAVLKNAAGTTIWTRDNLALINDTSTSLDQWVSGPAPTYIGATSFSLVGDQTGTFHVGRRLKTTNSGGTIYSTITASVFGAVTTVTVVNDSGTLDAGLSAVSYALLSNANHSIPSFQAAGDLLSQSAAGTISRIAVGAAGTVPMSRAAATSKIAYVPALTKAIYGFTYANNVADATNDIDIAAGGAMDSTGAYWITGAASTKRLDAAWAVGSGNGGLDTGSIGNSDYYIYTIARSDTGVVDYIFSLAAPSVGPLMPTNYDFFRAIGWFKRVGGTIVAFHTYETEGGGLEFSWDAPTQDINLANTLTTSRRTDAVKVPLGFSVIAELSVYLQDASASASIWIGCPDHTDAAPAAGTYMTANTVAATDLGIRIIFVRTSSAGLIAARSSLATVDVYQAGTQSFRWARRN